MTIEEQRIIELEAAVDDIGRQALSCWMDMQGRLLDDEHRRAHDVLGFIVKRSAFVLPLAST